jgi:hypothetical protein
MYDKILQSLHIMGVGRKLYHETLWEDVIDVVRESEDRYRVRVGDVIHILCDHVTATELLVQLQRDTIVLDFNKSNPSK